MTRQALIVEGLEALKEMDAIQAFKREADPTDPARVRWHIQVSALKSHYLKTPEAELLLAGADLTLTAKCR